MDDFPLRALIGGLGVAIVAAPLGSFVIWRRMAYFGDTLAHAALLGVALGYVAGISADISVIVVCFGVAVMLIVLQRDQRLASDTLLGILSHGALAMGLIGLALSSGAGVDPMSYLFGDILAVGMTDIAWVYGGGLVVVVVLTCLWRPLLAIAIDEELAMVEGVPVTAMRLVLMVLLALVVTLAMKVVGVLLATSLLIIPAAAVRGLAATPEQMAAMAAVAGALAVASGLWASLVFDIPSGPAIVVAALVLFAVSMMVSTVKRRR